MRTAGDILWTWIRVVYLNGIRWTCSTIGQVTQGWRFLLLILLVPELLLVEAEYKLLYETSYPMQDELGA
jgi:hypothetical protein